MIEYLIPNRSRRGLVGVKLLLVDVDEVESFRTRVLPDVRMRTSGFLISSIRTHTQPSQFVSYTDTLREVRRCECRTFTKGVPQLKQGLVYCIGPNHCQDFSEEGIASSEY